MLLGYPGHAANDARTVVNDLLVKACRVADCWPRNPHTGARLKRVHRLRSFLSSLDLAGVLHPDLQKAALRCKKIGDRGSHGKPVTPAEALAAIEIGYGLLKFQETMQDRFVENKPVFAEPDIAR